MRINELILEQQLDELNLKGLGQGIGKAIGGVAGGAVQGVKNVWSGMKQGYQSGQDALKPDGTPAAPSAPSTGGAPAAPTSTGTAPTGNAPVSNAGTAPNEIGGNNLLARAQQGTTQDPNAPKQPAPQGEQPPAQEPAAPTAQEPAAPAAPTAQEPAAPAEAPAMKAAEIVQGLTDIWGKATANQGSMTSSPQVQQQLIAMAKDAGLAGRKVESRNNKKKVVVEFHSKFLGRNL
jgi:hypothetical protein